MALPYMGSSQLSITRTWEGLEGHFICRRCRYLSLLYLFTCGVT